jgi:hypothetical protein
MRLAVQGRGKLLTAVAVLGVYGLCYLAVTRLLGVPDAAAVLRRVGIGRRRTR